MALIPKPPFPDVPKLPGVPQVRRSLQFPAAPPPILGIALAVQRIWRAVNAGPLWGIFWTDSKSKQLTQVLKPDSVIDFGYMNEYKVADFPIQDGAFSSYNKVASPFEIHLRMSKAGTLADRANFLDDLDRVLRSLKLLTILTPERVYESCTVSRTEIVRRANKGAYFLTDVDVFVRQIRQVTPQYTTTATATQNAQNANAQPPTNLGKVQAAVAPAGATFNPSTSVGVSP